MFLPGTYVKDVKDVKDSAHGAFKGLEFRV